MRTNLDKWGNSATIRIPEELNIDANNFESTSFRVEIEEDKLILRKTKFELLAERSKGETLNAKADIDWGDIVGKEVW